MFKNADDSIQESTKTLRDIKARSEQAMRETMQALENMTEMKVKSQIAAYTLEQEVKKQKQQ